MKLKAISVSLIITATVFLFGASIISSCTKEDMNEMTNLKEHKEEQIGKTIYSPQQISNVRLVSYFQKGEQTLYMLSFKSTETYDQTIDQLIKKVDIHEDNFVNSYPQSSEEELNHIEETRGHNSQQPLIDFENAYGFKNSLRSKYNFLEEKWLNNEVLNPETDPSNLYPYQIEEMSLLNEYAMVKIADKVIQLTSEGYIQIEATDVPTIFKIKNGDWSALNEPTVTTNIEGYGSNQGLRSANCKSTRKRKNMDEYIKNSKQVEKRVFFIAYPWKGKSSTTLVSYKKRGSRWKKHRMSLSVASQNKFYDNNCNSATNQAWTGWKTKTRKSLSKSYNSYGAFPGYRAKNGQSLSGYYKYANKSSSLVLSW